MSWRLKLEPQSQGKHRNSSHHGNRPTSIGWLARHTSLLTMNMNCTVMVWGERTRSVLFTTALRHLRTAAAKYIVHTAGLVLVAYSFLSDVRDFIAMKGTSTSSLLASFLWKDEEWTAIGTNLSLSLSLSLSHLLTEFVGWWVHQICAYPTFSVCCCSNPCQNVHMWITVY